MLIPISYITSLNAIKLKTIPALYTTILVAPVAYSIDKAVTDSSINSTNFFSELIKYEDKFKAPTFYLTCISLFFMLVTTNIFTRKLTRISISFLFVPLGIIKDIKLANKNNLEYNKINKLVYSNFLSRDIISLISALIFPSNIGLFVHYIFMLILQFPQTYFHEAGIEYCNIKKNKRIIKENFISNVFIRSIRSLILYGIGLKANLFFTRLLSIK